jgi:hypothetical protein
MSDQPEMEDKEGMASETKTEKRERATEKEMCEERRHFWTEVHIKGH